jgi:hypothetical protein
LIPIDLSDFQIDVDEELAKTTQFLLESSDELRTHSLSEYKHYLENLKSILVSETASDDILGQNWSVFKNAREFMKAPSIKKIPTHNDDEYDDFMGGFSGGYSFQTDMPSKEQQTVATSVKEQLDSLRKSFAPAEGVLISEQTFTEDSTEVAKQYIGAVHAFEEAQDNFFQGFLTNDEPNSLDDYFKETLM